MSKIADVKAYQIFDSRGYPTVLVEITSDVGLKARASVPSGASTGKFEAYELRDRDNSNYAGKGVNKAINNVNEIIAPRLLQEELFDQENLDKLLCELDGTDNKSKLGANAILGVSIAYAKLSAMSMRTPLYKYLSTSKRITLPVGLFNLINGGMHADNGLKTQEFMVVPIGFDSFVESIRAAVEVNIKLKKICKGKGLTVSVGDEGGIAPKLDGDEEALGLICTAIHEAGYNFQQVKIALDVAASSFFSNDLYDGQSSQELINYYAKIVDKYPVISIEDGLSEEDWNGWSNLTQNLGNKVQLVGDDLFVTNTSLIKKGIESKSANAVLIKPNQIGTVTETLAAITLAQSHSFATVISHRSGDTEDSFIADLAVATNSSQIKSGAPCRSERLAKYNRLMFIEQKEKGNTTFIGKQAFNVYL